MKSQNSPIGPIKYTGPDKERGYDPRNNLASTNLNYLESRSRLYRPTVAERHDFDLLKGELLLNQSMLQSGRSLFQLADLPETQPDMSVGELAALELAISLFRPGLSKFQYLICLRVSLKPLIS